MDLIKKMLSTPLEVPLTSTQRFTFVSAVMAYCITGLSMCLVPDLWNMVLDLDLSADGRGYFILVASGLVDIGLCLVVLARSKSSQIPHHGPVLGTILGRLLLVNGVLISFYTQGIINARFALMFGVLDSTLAVLTYIVWSLENNNASLMKFLRDIWCTVNPCNPRPPPYPIFQVLGIVQFITSFLSPSILISSDIVPSIIKGSHSEGLLRSYFVILAIHGILHILATGSQNDSFPIASVFYRMTWNIPIFIFLGITSEVPEGLANVVIIYDVIFIIVTIVLFKRQQHVKTN